MRWLKIAFVGFAVLFLVVMMGQLWIVALPFQLAVGWIGYLARVLPQVELDVLELGFAVCAVVLLVAGVHVVGSRSTTWRSASNADSNVAAWRLRWSASLVAALLLVFAANIAVIGAVHQLSWIARSDEPFIVNSWNGVGYRARRLCSSLRGGKRTTDDLRAELWQNRQLRYESRGLNVIVRNAEAGPLVAIFPRAPHELERHGGYLCSQELNDTFDGSDLDQVLAANGFRSGEPNGPNDSM